MTSNKRYLPSDKFFTSGMWCLVVPTLYIAFIIGLGTVANWLGLGAVMKNFMPGVLSGIGLLALGFWPLLAPLSLLAMIFGYKRSIAQPIRDFDVIQRPVGVCFAAMGSLFVGLNFWSFRTQGYDVAGSYFSILEKGWPLQWYIRYDDRRGLLLEKYYFVFDAACAFALFLLVLYLMQSRSKTRG